MIFFGNLVLLFGTIGMIYGYYPGNWIPSYGCLEYGCSMQQGCSRWNFQRYPCYYRCTFNRCTGSQIDRRLPSVQESGTLPLIQEPITQRPLENCFRITNLANGKTLGAGQSFDPDNKLKYAVASNETGEHSNDLWTLELAYGATYFLKNRHTSEYLTVNQNNKTYLVGNTPMDPTFEFKPILLDHGWSKIQLQAMCNRGYLFVRSNETFVQDVHLFSTANTPKQQTECV